MTSSLISISIPPQTRPYIITSSSNNTWLHSPPALFRYPSKLTIPLSSSSSSTSTSTPVVVDDASSPPPDALPVQSESATQASDALPLSGCKACGREELEKGCNGEGRIQGGIATVPGFGWWPIKAYRPCPGFVVSGGRYRRRGQSMDEVAFGRGERRGSFGGNSSEVQASKKKKDPEKFKK